MSIRKIITEPDPILRQISKPIWNYMNVQSGGEQEGGYPIVYGWHPWLLGRPTLSIKNMKKFAKEMIWLILENCY